MTQWTPASARARGACSRLEPEPKFLPPTTIVKSLLNSFSRTNGTLPAGRPRWPSGTLLIAYMPKNLRSSGMDGLNERYWAGMIWSVSMLSPRTYALPVMTDSITAMIDQRRGRDKYREILSSALFRRLMLRAHLCID